MTITIEILPLWSQRWQTSKKKVARRVKSNSPPQERIQVPAEDGGGALARLLQSEGAAQVRRGFKNSMVTTRQAGGRAGGA
eukprot:13877644-Alexandrium_andersonii.AAC.1